MLNVLEDAEGKFARDSGIYLSGSSGGVAFITASGKKVGKKYLHGVKEAAIKEALDDWRKLPEDERRPGAIQVGDRGPIDRKHGNWSGRSIGPVPRVPMASSTIANAGRSTFSAVFLRTTTANTSAPTRACRERCSLVPVNWAPGR